MSMTIEIPAGVVTLSTPPINGGTTIVDVTKFPSTTLVRIFEYGLKQAICDSYAGGKKDGDYQSRFNKRLRKMLDGTWAGDDPVHTRAVEIALALLSAKFPSVKKKDLREKAESLAMNPKLREKAEEAIAAEREQEAALLASLGDMSIG